MTSDPQLEYGEAIEHLGDEFRLLAQGIRADVERVSSEVGNPNGRGVAGESVEERAPSPQLERTMIDARVARTRQKGHVLPLVDLFDELCLSRLEREILVTLLAWELDPDIRALLRWIGGERAEPKLDLALLAAVARPGLVGRREVLSCLGHGGRLRRYRLVLVDGRLDEAEAGPFERRVRVHPQLARFALCGPTIELDEAIQAFASLIRWDTPRPPWIVDVRDRERLVGLFERGREQSGRLRLLGPAGVGKKLFARQMVPEQPLLVVEMRRWLDQIGVGSAQIAESLESVLLEAVLRRAVVYLDCDSDDRLDRALCQRIGQIFDGFPGLLFVAESRRSEHLGRIAGETATEIPIGVPGLPERAELWRRATSTHVVDASIDYSALASQFALSGGQIEAAVESAIAQHGNRLDESPLREAARRQVSSTLAGLAERVEESAGWDDVVLSDDLGDALSELRAFAVRRRIVFDDWGFGRKFLSGHGLTALFWGPPGTGKTMVAAILARDLGLELFRIDLSRVVSKWVGETEKNLSRIFDAAEHAQALLLFDEADALFSTRTEVRSANDRYGNLEVNYLLQRMEAFDGTTILTTNHATAIDKAFQRRLRFRLHFPAPDETARTRLWQKMLPAEAPVEGPIAWQKLAAAYDLSGGHIKNAVLRAAFRAADRGAPIRMNDLREAAIVECRETGRLVKS